MAIPVQFEFWLTGTGWAEGRLAVGDSSAAVTASYLSDALGDLLRAVRSLTQGADEAQATWYDEPGEVRWVFKEEDSSVHIQVVNVGTIRSRRWLDVEVPLVVLIAAIAQGSRDTLSRYGTDGFEEEWARHPFPVEELQALERWLSTQQRDR